MNIEKETYSPEEREYAEKLAKRITQFPTDLNNKAAFDMHSMSADLAAKGMRIAIRESERDQITIEVIRDKRIFENKMFEIRDRGTCIIALGIRVSRTSRFVNLDRLNRMLWRKGYPPDRDVTLLTNLSADDKCLSDYYAWGNRTMSCAHKYIDEHWDELKSGDLIDVQCLLGERLLPIESEFPL